MTGTTFRRAAIPFSIFPGLIIAFAFLYFGERIASPQGYENNAALLIAFGPIATIATISITFFLEPIHKIKVSLLSVLVWSIFAHHLAFGTIYDIHKANPPTKELMIDALLITSPSIISGFLTIAFFALLRHALAHHA